MLESKDGLGYLGFRWSYADNLRVLARGADCTNVTNCLQPPYAVVVLPIELCENVQSPGLSPCVAVSPAGWRSSRGSLLALSNRGALSILDASFMCGRFSCLVSGQRRLTVRMEQRAFGSILCVLWSDWGLRWLDVCICGDAPEKGFAFATREGAAGSHQGGKSSLTRVHVPSWIVGNFRVCIRSGSFRFSLAWVRAHLFRSLSRRSFGACALPVLNQRLSESVVSA